MRNRKVMITHSLSQPRKRGTHFFASQQRFHGLFIDFGPLFADLNTLLYLAGRNDNYTISIRHDQISRIDYEWPDLFRRCELHRSVQS
jgi:hypothetical protein